MGVTVIVGYCPSGQQLVGNICVDCHQAFYKDNMLNPQEKFEMCKRCPKGKITNSTKSTSANDCNIGMYIFMILMDGRVYVSLCSITGR